MNVDFLRVAPVGGTPPSSTPRDRRRDRRGCHGRQLALLFDEHSGRRRGSSFADGPGSGAGMRYLVIRTPSRPRWKPSRRSARVTSRSLATATHGRRS